MAIFKTYYGPVLKAFAAPASNTSWLLPSHSGIPVRFLSSETTKASASRNVCEWPE